MRKKLSTVALWCVLLVLFVVLFQLSKTKKPGSYEDFQTFQQHLADGKVETVRVNDYEIIVTLADTGDRYLTTGIVEQDLLQALAEKGVLMESGEEPNLLRSVLIYGLPLVLLAAFLVYFLKHLGGGTANIMSLGKSKARLLSETSSVTFADVGGCQEAKELLADVIDFLKNGQRWTDAGVRLPRGILLEGPPGCGKTLLARAVAGETDAPFYCISASEFVEMFVGIGAARVRDMFETAAKNSPAVIFIDELDAVGRRRGSGLGAGHDEREQTLNQILVCMDGFERYEHVVVIAATNRPDILDTALVRAGRFDRSIRVPEPTYAVRLEMLQIHTKKKTLAEDVSLEEIAERTAGFSGADIENLANEAGVLAVRRLRQVEQNGEQEKTDGLTSTEPLIYRGDFLQALEPKITERHRFSKLDSVLIESATQLSEPAGKACVRLTLPEDQTIGILNKTCKLIVRIGRR